MNSYSKWLIPGLGIKRWVGLLLFGMLLIISGIIFSVLKSVGAQATLEFVQQIDWRTIVIEIVLGGLLVGVGLKRISQNILAPYRQLRKGSVVDIVYEHSKRQKGLKVVAIGGGTGLPSVLRGLKLFTNNITAVVTVADDGGSSGRLRRDMGVLPPGDLRNNIAALADDESFMTRLFQYRFKDGDLDGHAFGNLFITAMAGITGSMEAGLAETGKVLNIQGHVLPATLDDVTLCADIMTTDGQISVHGESYITAAGGQVQKLWLEPANVSAYSESIRAIIDANIVVLGPGSLYTSILPNLLVEGIANALRETKGCKVYVCNVATQPGETDGYTVAEHILAIEKYVGRGLFDVIIANNVYLPAPGTTTEYVQPAPEGHGVLQRYNVQYTDLVDPDRPWRHDPQKLAAAILTICDSERNTITH